MNENASQQSFEKKEQKDNTYQGCNLNWLLILAVLFLFLFCCNNY